MPLNLNSLKFEVISKKVWSDVPVTVTHTRLPGRTASLQGVGVDPGRKFGVAVIGGHDVYIFDGIMPKEDEQWKYGIRSYDMMAQPTFYHGSGPAVVEGSAYGMKHGEANLAYIRFGFVLGLYYAGFDVDLVPPATIRAQALGSGRMSGLEMWPELSPHGADALAAALYAAGIRRDK